MFKNKNIKKTYKAPVVLNCPLKGKEDKIDYKNIQLLKKFISTRGRIFPSSKTGVCAKNQRALSREIKKARFMALLPFTQYV
jgi:small subunit ribosomal protein S18